MIVIDNKHNCCGCGACVQICPQSCISMQRDEEGFYYPKTDSLKCSDCGLCEKVCPMMQHLDKNTPEQTYITYSSVEETRKTGSSGGMFQTMAEYVINQGGIVFGARFDKSWNVVHDYTDTLEGLKVFCGSKYVQSHIGESYRQTKTFLENGKTVLFSGTPCQIHGLKCYLRKQYTNLLTIDFICHGVPSPKVWQAYVDYTARKNCLDITQIESICFRNKCSGWKNYSVTLRDKKGVTLQKTFKSDTYMQLFLKDYILRPSCYGCRFKDSTNNSDITLGDFWGVSDIHPEWDDDKGLSVLLVNTSKGAQIVSLLDSVIRHPLSLQECIHKNTSYSVGAQEPAKRPLFWNSFNSKGYDGAVSFLKSIRPSAFSRMKYRIKTLFKSLLH